MEKRPLYTGLKFFNKTPNHIEQLKPAKFSREIKNILNCKAYYSLENFLNGSW